MSGSTLNQITQISNAIASTTGALSSLLGGDWRGRLRPASYGGITFGVLGGESRFGRRNAVHEYPYRDTPWVEDLGRAARRINLSGFIVGDDVIAKRNALIAVCESPGQSQLVHPTLGTLTVSLLDFATIERWDQGRVFELNFVFIESGQRSFPAVELSTLDDVSAASILADIAAQADFVSGVASTLRYGSAVIKQASSTATSWGAMATRLSNDATGLCNTVGALQGSYGRYFGGRSINALTGIKASTATVSSLISQGVAARATVASAVNNLISSATGLGS